MRPSVVLLAPSLLALLASGCRTETTTRTVNLHLSPSCTIPPNSSGQYIATGDYEPAGRSSLLATGVGGQTIDGIPANVASLSWSAALGDGSQWSAVTLVPATGDLDMLVLPGAQSCTLAPPVGFAMGMVFGAVSSSTLIASGGAMGTAQPKSFRVNLGTGGVSKMPIGLKLPRTHAAFAMLGTSGTQAIVTGGLTASEAVLISAATGGEIYDDSLGDFEPAPIPLATDRADHAAVTLASGNVVLVGGYGDSGLIKETELISFSAGQWQSAESTPLLQTARTSPYAVRLADGTILVGGGFDSAGNTVGSVEFYSPDFSTMTAVISPTPSFLVRSQHAFVALDGGGALLVTAPDPTDPSNFQRAWFLMPNSAPVAITPDVGIALTDVKLVAAAGGRALLWTGTSWLVYDPWTGFAGVVASTSVPASPLVAPDPGMRAWVTSDGTATVWRDSTRNVFSTEGPYLATDTSSTAPDSFPAPAFTASGGVTLPAGESVFVADARYLDVSVDVQAPAGSGLPYVVLRAGTGEEVEVGGASCALMLAGSSTLHVERHGGTVSYALGQAPTGALSPCATITPDARVSVGVRGSSGGASAMNLTVTRAGVPL